VRVAVIGMGVMGTHHWRVLRALGHEVVTVDPDPGKNADLPLIAALQQVDAAVVAVPPAAIPTVAVDVGAKARLLMVEKPMADSLQGATALAEHVKHLVVGYTERHNPAVEELRRHLDLIGDIHHVAIQRLGLPPDRSTGHVALDLATHDLDILRYLGFAPQLLHAAGSPRHVVATLDLGGPTATIEASHLHPRKIRTLTVTGSEGMLALDYQRQTLDLVESSGITPIPVTYEEPLARQWRAFPHGPDASDGIATLRLAVEIAGCDRSASPAALPVAGATATGASHVTVRLAGGGH
jgi:predicted dehydrogenase